MRDDRKSDAQSTLARLGQKKAADAQRYRKSNRVRRTAMPERRPVRNSKTKSDDIEVRHHRHRRKSKSGLPVEAALVRLRHRNTYCDVT